MINQEKFNDYVKQLKNASDRKHQPLELHYLSVYQNQKTWSYQFKKEGSLSDIRSLSKTIMTILLGQLLEAQAFKTPINLDTYVYPFLKEMITLTNQANETALNQIQIRHLLNHTIGYDDVLMMRDDIKDIDPHQYLNYLMNYPIIHQPGSHYLYSNAGFYLLSILLQTLLNQDLEVTFNQYLFKDLNITNYQWERYGPYLAGATRLWLHPHDLLKIGQLLLNDGYYQNKQIISPRWIAQMKTITSLTPHVDQPQRTFRRYAYGHGLWLAKDNDIFFGHGTDGQTLIIVPHKNMIVLTLSHQRDVLALENILNIIIEEN